jgi:4-amino-4-deoxychorismate lyase
VSLPLVSILDGREIPPDHVDEIDPRRSDPVPMGVFETVLVLRDRPLLAREHVTRHVAACEDLGLSAPDPDRLVLDLAATARHAKGRRARLRVLRWAEDARTRALVTLSAEPGSSSRTTVGIAPERRPCGAWERKHKRVDAADLDRIREAATAAGHLDLLVLDERGRVLEGSKTNVFWRRGKTLLTPATTLPLLPGIRRAWLLEAARRAGMTTREVEAPLEDLLDADEVLLTNAILRVARRIRVVSR